MAIEHNSTIQEAVFYNPLEDFQETAIEVEIREDPLTGRHTRIVPDNFLLPEAEPDLEPVVGDDEGCFFCPAMVTEATPMYPDFVGRDRGSVGQATSFPNLNPYGAHSNVVVLTEDHYVPIDEFTSSVFGDGLEAALDYITAVFEHDPEAEVASINMNFLRPAGSSIIHPHLQTLVDDRGTNAESERLAAARRYAEMAGEDYYGDLLEKERESPRYIGDTGSVEWLAPYAPRHHRHFLGVAEETGIPSPDGEMVTDLADGIVRVLRYFGDVSLNSFNLGIHLTRDEAIRPTIDIVARSVFEEYYWSDATFFETVHDEAVVDVAPETYAEEAREFF